MRKADSFGEATPPADRVVILQALNNISQICSDHTERYIIVEGEYLKEYSIKQERTVLGEYVFEIRMHSTNSTGVLLNIVFDPGRALISFNVPSSGLRYGGNIVQQKLEEEIGKEVQDFSNKYSYKVVAGMVR